MGVHPMIFTANLTMEEFCAPLHQLLSEISGQTRMDSIWEITEGDDRSVANRRQTSRSAPTGD